MQNRFTLLNTKNSGSPPSRPLVFLPGWGFDGRITGFADSLPSCITLLAPVVPASLVEDLHDFLREQGISRADIMGWSMGSCLALDYGRRYPGRVGCLYLLAMRNAWPREEIAAIRGELAVDRPGFLKTFYRKCFLGQRQHYTHFQASLESDYLDAMNEGILDQGLDYLQNFTWEMPPTADLSIYLGHGARDIIAPLAERPSLPGAVIETWAKAGHLLFLDPEFSVAEVKRKMTIRARFSRSAVSYDATARVQQQSGRELLALLPAAEDFASILELGCGTGNFTGQLLERFPDAEICGIDFSAAMIAAAKEKVKSAAVEFRCLDGETFLIENNRSYDLVVANATLQWFRNLPEALRQIKRSLAPHGCFAASFFGPQSMVELSEAFRQVGKQPMEIPAGSFFDSEQLYGMMTASFDAVGCREIRYHREFASVQELLLQIRKTGVGGYNPGVILTRSRLQEIEKWFVESFGGVRTTYQILLVQGRNDP